MTDERERGGAVLLPAGLDLLGRQDEPTRHGRGRPQLDRQRGDVVLAVGPVSGVARRRVQPRRLLRGVCLAVHALDQPLHVLGQATHLTEVDLVHEGLGGEAPRKEDELGVAVIAEDAAEELPCHQVAHRAHLRLRESPRSDVRLVGRNVAGGVDVQRAPHVAVVAVGVDADAAALVSAPVLAPEPVRRPGVLVSVGVHHRGHPHLPAAAASPVWARTTSCPTGEAAKR